MKFFTIIVFQLQICFKCVSFSSLYSTSTKKSQGDCQNFSRRILFLDTRIFFCIFQSEATDNGIPVILNLFNVEYIELMDSELRGPASTLLDIVDIVSRATSVYYFHPSSPSNIVYRQCVHVILHANIERERRGEGGGSELCTNKRVCLGA